jgi:hypothetical protein
MGGGGDRLAPNYANKDMFVIWLESLFDNIYTKVTFCTFCFYRICLIL